MNYLKIYNDLVNKRKFNDILKYTENLYTEKHHIIPKCLSGSDNKNNLVRLTAREHYIAHLLLCKIHPNNSSIFCAFNAMHYGYNRRNFKYNSKLYEIYKKKYAELKSHQIIGVKNPISGKIWIFNTQTGQNLTWDKNIIIPNGWIVGRCTNFEEYKQKKIKKEIFKDIEYRKKLKILNKAYRMYNWYLKYGYDSVVKQFNYKFTNANLQQFFKRYIVNYTSHKYEVYKSKYSRI